MKNTGSGGAWLRCAVVGAAAFKAAAPRVSGRVYNAFTDRRSRFAIAAVAAWAQGLCLRRTRPEIPVLCF